MRQTTTYIVIALLMAVTVGHAATYAGSFEPAGWAWLGWAYAIAVDLAIAVCAYYTRWKATRTWASAGYIAFVSASGVLNIAYIQPWLHEPGAWVYALFPTVAQALLGFLARDAGKLTKRRETSEAEVKLRDQLRELRKHNKELAQRRALKDPTRADYDELCAGINGNAPTDARGVNRLLQDNGYYARPDATARSWCARGE
jgi:hypothetical protein